jgi:hypothetical protein
MKILCGGRQCPDGLEVQNMRNYTINCSIRVFSARLTSISLLRVLACSDDTDYKFCGIVHLKRLLLNWGTKYRLMLEY